MSKPNRAQFESPFRLADDAPDAELDALLDRLSQQAYEEQNERFYDLSV